MPHEDYLVWVSPVIANVAVRQRESAGYIGDVSRMDNLRRGAIGQSVADRDHAQPAASERSCEIAHSNLLSIVPSPSENEEHDSKVGFGWRPIHIETLSLRIRVRALV